jgi:phosphate uptake regulator
MRLAPLGLREVAEQCRRRARLDNTDNMTAIVLLLAAKAIEQQADRLIRLAHNLEQTEARS